eukprot:6178813-Pleurochrysis_carterae.AAC.5
MSIGVPFDTDSLVGSRSSDPPPFPAVDPLLYFSALARLCSCLRQPIGTLRCVAGGGGARAARERAARSRVGGTAAEERSGEEGRRGTPRAGGAPEVTSSGGASSPPKPSATNLFIGVLLYP